ncbi:cyclic nucleotide-binding domain-containing protein (plasmid) [Phaeobacter sp. BS52]|uniref:Crp/Fnr family transcriptional regulator n=1 Tax=Phaeobacter sp. BS52 TaxID=2907241 RepID=UPI0037047F57
MKNLTSDRWLDHCLPQTQAALLAQGRSRQYGKGAVIHQIGDPATELFFIRSGAVRFGAVNQEGKALIVRDLTAGHWFGFIGCYGAKHAAKRCLSADRHGAGACATQRGGGG